MAAFTVKPFAVGRVFLLSMSAQAERISLNYSFQKWHRILSVYVSERDALASVSEARVSSPWRRVFPRCHSDATALLKTGQSVVIRVSVYCYVFIICLSSYYLYYFNSSNECKDEADDQKELILSVSHKF